MSDAGSYLVVWDAQGGEADVDLALLPIVEMAVRDFVESCGGRDSLLTLRQMNGTDATILASQIVGWAASTPESRALDRERVIAKRAEGASLRAIYGEDDE